MPSGLTKVMLAQLRLGLIALLLAFAVQVPALEPIPDKTVVLTFDDSPRSHREFVAPLLKELGFGATFFVSARWMDDTKHFMTWQEIAELNDMGFEIGNHSWSHLDFGMPEHANRLAGQLALVDYALEQVGVPRPTSFAWCGNSFGPEALAILEASGYRFARRGMQPEVPYGQVKPGPLYDPAAHHRLLLPSAGDAYPVWTMENFRMAVDRARDGKIAILQFHGVPDRAHPWVNTPPSKFREYMAYLQAEGFNVIAMRDLERYVDIESPVADGMTAVHYGPKLMRLPAEMMASRVDSSYWLGNMLSRHRYTVEEAGQVLGWPASDVEALQATLASPSVAEGIAPYPGGRHPRIGFLEGAIDSLRGTKASIFSPWGDGGYALIDLPEAVFSNKGLHFLAHTHIPTIWDMQHSLIENRDWQRLEGGGLTNLWTLPDGVSIGAEARPVEQGADFSLWLENGTSEMLTGLRTQVCVMLKGLPGFEAQTLDNKAFTETSATATSSDGRRAVTVTFSHCGRTWGNPLCPCIHADPIFPDCPPGGRSEVTGQLRFNSKPH